MNIKLIKTEEDYQNALRKLEKIFDAKTGTIESDEADILGLMSGTTNLLDKIGTDLLPAWTIN